MTTLNILAPSGKANRVDAPAQEYTTTTTVDVEAQRRASLVRKGQFAWSLLHRYRGCDPQWLELWVYFIPQRCECKDGYQKILEQLPPDFSSPEAFFAWGVALHNAVNRKLGKPEITIEQARKIWRRDDANTENSRPDLP